jgi:hypothetical protein
VDLLSNLSLVYEVAGRVAENATSGAPQPSGDTHLDHSHTAGAHIARRTHLVAIGRDPVVLRPGKKTSLTYSGIQKF